MEDIAKNLSLVAGVLLSVVITFIAIVYLFGVVIWMHAPAIPALLFTLVMASPFFLLAWILLKLGRSSHGYKTQDGQKKTRPD